MDVKTIIIDNITVLSITAIAVIAVLVIVLVIKVKNEGSEVSRYSKIAYTDVLTGVKNRTAFYEDFPLYIADLVENNQEGALIYIDLNCFKKYNDLMGHEAGDAVLCTVSKRLTESLDSIAELYRIGGDEFAMLINPASAGEIDKIGVLIKHAAKQDVFIESLNNTTPLYGASMGVTRIPKDGRDVDQLLSNADIAMYQSKVFGHMYYYELELQEKHELEMAIVFALEHIDEDNEFKIYFQPIMQRYQRKVAGAEALIRWESSELGFLYPNAFIHIAEKYHLVHKIDYWVLAQGLKQLKKWREDDYNDLSLIINLSEQTVFNNNFYEKTVELINFHNINPGKLIIEITESTYVKMTEDIVNNIRNIQWLGVRLAVDDFGTGYSSLEKLASYDLTYLKIDRKFIQGIYNDEKNQQMVDAIVALAQRLQIGVVIQGVEEKEQLDYIFKLPCMYLQGYYFSKPLLNEDFLEYCQLFLTK
jgi:diguanylate cyclase (GGDEF)-like protein